MVKINILFLIVLLSSCRVIEAQKNEVKIAFMADVHFADVYPDSITIQTQNLPLNKDGEKVLIRSMEAQLHSTRLFNENYFAFTAALDDAVKRGIKIIAMPGDFSDDGQPLHIRGVNRIMEKYAEDYGVSFFMINGNHDPTRPFGKEGGKRDFLGDNGKSQPIMSEENMYVSDELLENPPIVLQDLKEWGYKGIVEELSSHGFFPHEDYIFWGTPFSDYKYENYTFERADAASDLEKRTVKGDDLIKAIPDVSYLVEPVDGLWLLALDANVYLPQNGGKSFSGAGIGYNEVLLHKNYLLEWTGKVVEEANRLGKTLIAFSHYPMLDFNDGASEEMKELFGEKGFQAYRNPSEEVGKSFADLGLKVHVGGHMHLNDTEILTTENNNTLVNIQTPSFGAFIPAYKVITVKNSKLLEVETIILDSVADFNSFFSLYEKELSFLQTTIPEKVWKKEILATTSYLDFTKAHLQELIRLRFLPNDWPVELSEYLENLNGWELLVLANTENKLFNNEAESLKNTGITLANMDSVLSNIQIKLKPAGLTKSDFLSWDSKDLISDFYMMRSSDELAFMHIDPKRLECYKFLFNCFQENDENESILPLKQLAQIFQKQIEGAPSANFSIDLERGVLTRN